MRKIAIYTTTVLSIFSTAAIAQNQPDSLTTRLRDYVARNFSEARTFNLYWQTMPTQDYTLHRNGSDYENGELRDIHYIQFSGTVPIISRNRFSLYANWQTNFYQFKAQNSVNNGVSSLFHENEDGYSYHKGTIATTYKGKLFGKPFILNANLSGDGWNEGFEKMSGTFSATMILKSTSTSSFSVGAYGMTLYNEVPVLPIISYTNRFASHWILDITMPSRFYVRHDFRGNHRLSAGAQLESENFYFKPGLDYLPKTCFYTKETFKPEIVYEYIINEHFYLIARAGGSAVIRGGVYGTDRKGTDRKGIDRDPLVKVKNPMTPFFNLGISYNIFK